MAKKINAFLLTGRVELDANRAKKDLREVERGAKSTTSAMNGLKGSVGGVKGAAAGLSGMGSPLSFITEGLKVLPGLGLVAGGISKITGAMTQGISTGFDYNRIIEENTIAFETILKSSDKAKAHLNELARFAETSPFEFPELVKSSKMMQAMGFSAEETIPTLRAVSNASSTLGADMESIIRALGQMRAKGKASAEEMNQQLAEQGIPAWRYLAEAVGKTDEAFAKLTSEQQIQRLQKLMEQGRISGKGAAQAIISGMEREFGGLGERVANETLTGIEANLSDVTSRLAGTASKPAFEKYKQTLRGVLNIANSETAANLAKGAATGTDAIFGALGSVGSDFKQIGFDVTAGLGEGIAETTGSAVNAAKGLGSSVIAGAKEILDINSPSREFISIGESIVEGLELGLSKGQARVYAAMKRLFDLEPDFLPTLIGEAVKRGINPDDLLNLIAIESGFNKSITNKFGYAGLGQIGRKERASIGLPFEDAQAKQLFTQQSATWQLLNGLFPLIDTKMRENSALRADPSLARLYAAWGSGSVKRSDEAVHAVRGGYRAKAYKNNPLWDANGDGRIQQFEFGIAAQDKLGAGKFFSVNGSEISRSNPMPIAFAESREEIRSRLGLDDAPVYRAAKRDPFANPTPSNRALDSGLTDKAFEPAIRNVRTVHEILADMRNRPIKPEDLMPVQMGMEASLVLHKFEQMPKALDAATASAQKLNATVGQTTPIITAVEKKTEGAALSWKEFGEGFKGIMTGALSDTSAEFDEWGMNLLASFAGLVQQMAAEAIAAQITKSLFGTQSQTPGGGAGGMLGTAMNWISGLFGGFRAEGGGVSRGRSYIVGEEGPELYTPGANGFITPNHALGGGGGTGKVEVAMRNVVVFDKSHVTEAMMSSQGEHVTMAHIDNNISQIAEKVSRYIG